MTASVVSLDERRPHFQGTALCIDCKHEWQAVKVKNNDPWLECPDCGLFRGRFKFEHAFNGRHFECNCGNDLFMWAESGGLFCPNCGAYPTP